MKKWLVGLMAAGLCAASAWAAGVATLPVNYSLTDKSVAWQSLDGVTQNGLGSIYADGSAKFDTTGDWMAIQFDADPGTLSFKLKGNSGSGGEGTLSFKVEESADGETWSLLEDISAIEASQTLEPSYDLSADSRYVRWTYENRVAMNLALNNVVITSGGPAEFSVSLALSGDSQIAQGSDAYVTATPQNAAEGVVGYEWTSANGGSGTDNVYTIDTSVTGDFTVSVKATDAEDNEAEASIEFSVVKAYTVSVEDGIQNGTVEIKVGDAEAVPGPVNVTEGTIVTVIATPADRTYQIESITVETEGGTPVGLSKSNTFEMPAENVWVGATFVEKPAGGDVFTKIASADALEEGEYVFTGVGTDGTFAMQAAIPESGTKFLQCKFIEFENDEIENPDEDLVWTLAKNGNNWTIHNDAVGFVGYLNSGNSANAEATATDNSSWTITYANGFYSVENVGTSGRFLHFNTATNAHRFACYTSVTFANSMSFFKKESGEKPFSITLDPAADFEVELNAVATVTATPKNAAEGDVSYEWTVGGTPVDATGAVLTLDTSAVTAEAVEVGCKATDASGAEATASVSYTVKTPAEPHAVNIAIGTQHGFVTADPTSAVEGTTVTLTATAEDGYKLASMTVTYGETTLTFTTTPATFEMPDADVYVGATFVEKPVVAGFTKITSLDELTEGEYVITGAKAAGEEYAMMASIAGTSTKYIERRAEAVTIEEEITVTDAEDSIIWTLAQGDNGWTIYNEAVGYAGYVAGGNSSGAETNASAKSSWTITASETAGLFLLENVDTEGRYLLYNASSPRFACYTNLTSGKHLALYKGSSGPAPLRVSLDQENPLRLDVGTGASVTATATGGEKPYTFAWECSTAPELNGTGETLAIPDTLGLGTYNVWLTVSDSSDPAREIIQAFVVVIQEPAVKYTATVADGILHGTVLIGVGDEEPSLGPLSVAAGETVKVYADPEDRSWKLDEITVLKDGGTVEVADDNSFTMPESDVTVTASFVENVITGDEFTRISSVADLADGTKVVLTDPDGKLALVAKVEGSVFTTAAVEPANDVITTDDATIIWTLKDDGNGNFSLYNEGAEKYAGHAGGASSNSGRLQADPFPNTISVADADANLFLIAATTADGGGAYRDLQFNQNGDNPRFAYYKGTQKNLRIYAAASGPAEPSISFMGSTEATLPDGTFTLAFSLDNFENESQFEIEWSLLDNDPGAIAAVEGDENKATYTWALTSDVEAKDYTITVSAKLDGVEIAGEEVTLTVLAAEPPAGEVTCAEGNAVNAVAGEELVLNFTATGFEVSYWMMDPEAGDLEDNGSTAVWRWTPPESDIDSTTVYTFAAFDANDTPYSCDVAVTVTEGGQPVGEATITAIKVDMDSAKVILTTDGTKVYSADSLTADPVEWSLCDTTDEGDGNLSVELPRSGAFYRAEP